MADLVIDGTAAADTLNGGADNDTVSGFGGNDSLSGFTGTDLISGGDGNDSAYGGSGADTIDGGAGNDVLNGDDGADTITGGDGADTIYAGYDSGGDTLTGGAGNDIVWGYYGNDVYIWGSGQGNDSYVDGGFPSETNLIRLTNLNPEHVTLAGPGVYTLTVKATGEALSIQSGQYSIEFANGVVWSSTDMNEIATKGATSAAGPPILGTAAGDSITGTSQGEYVLAYAGADTVDGAGGNDVLYGYDGTDSLSGGDGNDTLYADSGDGSADTLAGGAGNDMLWGGLGVDVYVWGSGQGNDNCVDAAFPSQTNLVRLTNLNPGDITLTGGAWHLITVKATGETLIIQSGPYQIEFANGVVWTSTNLTDIAAVNATSVAGTPILGGAGDDSLAGTSDPEFIFAYAGADTVDAGAGNDVVYGHNGDDSILGGDGNDTLYGGSDSGADTLAGGAGNDILWGGGGVDAYVWGSGLGNDTFVDAAIPGQENVVRLTNLNPGDVSLTGAGTFTLTADATGETLSLQSGPYRIEFANGVVWTSTNMTDLAAVSATAAPGAPIVGNDTAETIVGTNVGEFILAYGGDDIIDGGDGNDGLYGHNGSDSLSGGAGNDTLDGGADSGTDTLAGGTGNDLVRGGLGVDVYVWGSGLGNDTFVDAAFPGQENVVRLTNLNPGDVSLTGSGVFTLTADATGETLSLQSGPYRIEFANGVVWTSTNMTDLAAVNATAAPGAPIVGNDTAETIVGTSAGEFILAYGGDDVIDGGDGNDGLYGHNGSDSLSGGAGNDTLDAGSDSGTDTLDGGTGNDIVRGGLGVDVYVWGSGLGNDTFVDAAFPGQENVVRLTNLNPGDVSLTGAGTFTLTADATGETLSLQSGPYRIEFANGIVWTSANMTDLAAVNATAAPGAPIVGNDTAETIVGTSVGEFILAYGGDDVIDGGDGNDGLYGHNGSDSLSGGAGNDSLDAGSDSGTDTLDGGAGNDILRGGLGVDVYVWGSGQGNDTFVDAAFPGQENIVRLTNLNPGDVSLTGAGTFTLTADATGETLSLQSGPYRIEFANGIVWTSTNMTDLAAVNATAAPGAPIVGNDTAETIVGTSAGEFVLAYGGDDVIDTGDGNDGLYGHNGSDSLSGGAGNDTLFGGSDSGTDTLAGGAGNDILWGGLGVDVYVWGSGQGNDSFVDAAFPGQTNVVRLTNLNPADITLTGGGTFTMTVRASGETLLLQSGPYQIEFANGVVWTTANMNDIAAVNATSAPGAPVLGTAGAESLSGTSLGEFVLAYAGADTVDGGAGNDVIYGHEGSDSLSGGDGNDTLYADAGDGLADTLAGGAGNDMLWGGLGVDVYVWGSGQGNDNCVDAAFPSQTNLVRLTNLNPGDITLTGGAWHLITVKATGETLIIQSGPYQIEFANGVVWTSTNLTDIAAVNATSVAGTPILGGAGDDSLAGTSDPEFIFGYAGADTVDAGVGNDAVFGGDGADVIQGGDGNDSIDGQNGIDSISGGDGNDTIYGGGDTADTLAGGAGNDMLWGGLGVDVYVWGSGLGHDNCVDAAFPSQTNVVRLTNLNPDDITLTGGGWHLVTVKATGETLIIQSGPYQIEFANGVVWSSTNINDIASLGATSAPGAPIVGTDVGESITGTSLGEYILAYGGADTVTGGGGADTLIGGTANDRFVFGAPSDSPTTGQDRISSFAVSDLIDLSGIDADAGTGGDQAFTFIGTSAFSAAGQLRYVYSGGVVTLTGDVDGDGAADFRIDVTGVTSLAGTDFVL